jgi:hypothetical protein
MDRVTAFKYSIRFYTLELVLKTHGAILVESPLHTHMLAFQACCITSSACLTMKEILPATYSTNTALIAMERLFLNIIIIKWAHGARILSKGNTT